ncbi:condensation domain-containing protein [Streptomyces sp. SS7]|uniref:condensation domain-containing protein n=1 Tax=Streptomyces sp. SS7 TaxID=3108485 RepID=UPI0030EB6799
MSELHADAELSFAQQKLWFLDRLHPGSSAYNFDVVLRLSGELDTEALNAAVQRIIERHDVLRTTFPIDVRGIPFQHIAETLEIPLEFIDLTALPEHAREAEAHSVVTAWAALPFDLEKGPLLRVRLVRITEREHLLCFSFHHAVFDGWSIDVLYRELARHYTPGGPRTAQSAAAAPPKPALQYADHARRQRRRLSDGALDHHLDWWRAHLDGAPVSLSLPRPEAPADATAEQGAQLVSPLPPTTMAAVSALARSASATPFLVLLACYGLVLARQTGMRSLLVGTQVAGRSRPELRELIGLFVETMPIRVDLHRAGTFAELVTQVRESAWDTFAHDQVPFEAIVEAVRPPRVAGSTPLVQTAFAAPAAVPEPPVLAGLVAEPVALAPTTAKFALGMAVEPTADGQHRISLTYDPRIVDHGFARRLVQQYGEALATLPAAPETVLTGAVLDEAATDGTEHAPAAPAVGPPPHTDLENTLLALWRDVLKNDRVTVHDNFFDVGGQSLALAAVHARLERLLERELPMVAFYEHPTVTALSAHLSGTGRPGPEAPEPRAAKDRVERARALQRRRALHATDRG